MARPPKTVLIPLEKIGGRLRALRQHKDMSQVELARALGTKQSNISDIERGARGVTVQQLVKMARALGTTPDEILGETPPRAANGTGRIKDRRLLRRLQQIDSLSRRQKDALLTTIDTFLRGAGTHRS